MKMIKSLMLILVLAGASFAGEMPQLRVEPPPPTTKKVVTELLVRIVQSLLPLR